MTGEERARRLVTRMSHRQRHDLLRALQAAGAGRPSPTSRIAKHNAVWSSGVERADPPCGAGSIGQQPSLTNLLPLFQSQAWQEVWRPGEEYHLYLIGCSSLGRIATTLGVALAKAGTCAVGQLDRRISDLRRQGYASTVRRATRYEAQPGWNDWGFFKKHQLAPTPAACPIRASMQTLILTAPLGWTGGEVEAVVNEVLAPYRLSRFADSDLGRATCRDRAVDPTDLVRYSNTGKPVEAATELTLIRAQADGPRLAGLVAAAIARHVRAEAPHPTAAAWKVLDGSVDRVGLCAKAGGRPTKDVLSGQPRTNLVLAKAACQISLVSSLKRLPDV